MIPGTPSWLKIQLRSNQLQYCICFSLFFCDWKHRVAGFNVLVTSSWCEWLKFNFGNGNPGNKNNKNVSSFFVLGVNLGGEWVRLIYVTYLHFLKLKASPRRVAMEPISSNVVLSKSIWGVQRTPCQCMIGRLVLRPVDCYKGCNHLTTNHDPSLPVSHLFKPIFQVPIQQLDVLLQIHAGVHGSLEDLWVVTKFAIESSCLWGYLTSYFASSYNLQWCSVCKNSTISNLCVQYTILAKPIFTNIQFWIDPQEDNHSLQEIDIPQQQNKIMWAVAWNGSVEAYILVYSI